MGEKSCAVCATPFADRPAYLVQGAHWTRRHWWRTRSLICQACHDGRRGYFNNDHKALPFYWISLVGRGEQMPAAPCVVCGQLVIRNSDPLLKRATCSQSCSVSLTRSRNGNQGSRQPCEACGEPITTGRADSRYCSPACKQKAYRERQATQTALAPPLLDARGRRYPQRSQRKALESGLAALSGLCEAFAHVGTLEGTIRPSELNQWRASLADARRVVESLHVKLRTRAGAPDVPAGTAPAPSRSATRKNLTQGTDALSGLCVGLAKVTELTEEITPELAAQCQAQTAGALEGIGQIVRVLEAYSHAQP